MARWSVATISRRLRARCVVRIHPRRCSRPGDDRGRSAGQRRPTWPRAPGMSRSPAAGIRLGCRCDRCTTPTTCGSRPSSRRLTMFDGRFIERGSAEYEAARTDALFNARHPLALSGRDPRGCERSRCRRRRAAGQGARLEGGGTVGRARLGGMERARRRPADRPCRPARDDRRRRQPHRDGQPIDRGGQEFSPFLRRHGLVFPGGHCSTVGLGGYLLQGGQGWNSRQWGWGCENVLGVDVVTADGELVHADAEQNSDLYWAATRCRPGVLRRRHPLPPACASHACRIHAHHVRLPDRLLRRADHLGPRGAADARLRESSR